MVTGAAKVPTILIPLGGVEGVVLRLSKSSVAFNAYSQFWARKLAKV